MLNYFKQIFEGLDYAYGNFIREVSNLPTQKTKGKAFVIKKPLTDELWQKHLDGIDPSLGIFPVTAANVCKWGCIDYDEYPIDFKELNKKIKTFVQVNIGEESQKNGISPKNINQFVNYCRNSLSLNIIGLMCLPPINENPEKYFLYLNQLRNQADLCHLSMGMSNDYQIATKCGSTFLRIGSKILGERNTS
mgnify:CR=1 FL=1